MPVVRERGKVSRCGITGIVVAENETIAHSVVVAVLDDTKRRLDNDELFELRYEPSAKMRLPLISPADGGLSSYEKAVAVTKGVVVANACKAAT